MGTDSLFCFTRRTRFRDGRWAPSPSQWLTGHIKVYETLSFTASAFNRGLKNELYGSRSQGPGIEPCARSGSLLRGRSASPSASDLPLSVHTRLSRMHKFKNKIFRKELRGCVCIRKGDEAMSVCKGHRTGAEACGVQHRACTHGHAARPGFQHSPQGLCVTGTGVRRAFPGNSPLPALSNVHSGMHG